MPLIPLIGYAPDVSPLETGVLTNCAAMVPSLKGMRAAPSPQSTSLPALSTECRGAAILRKLDDTTRLVAGTASTIEEGGSSSWTDRSKSGGYSLGTGIRWRFAQFGNISLAAAVNEILQTSTGAAFDDAAANAPEGAIVEVANGFVFLFNVSDQGAIYDSGDRQHGWWAARDPGTWTPSIANEAYTGELTSTPGPITAGKKFGRSIIAYKQRSMYVGIYAGQTGWEFEQIPGEAGALTHEAVVDVGTPENPKHIFMGIDNFYSFDGSRPVPIGDAVKETVFGELNLDFAHAALTLHDRKNSLVYFYYPVDNSDNPNKCVVFNYKTGRWGRDDRVVEAAAEYISASITWDELGTSYTTWDSLPSLPWDTAFLAGSASAPAIFNSSHLLQILTGDAGSSSITTGDIGSDAKVTLASRVIPTFLTRSSTGVLTPRYRMSLGDSLSSDSQVSMTSKGRFDFMRSANWHRFVLEFTGNTEIVALHVDLQEDGEE